MKLNYKVEAKGSPGNVPRLLWVSGSGGEAALREKPCPSFVQTHRGGGAGPSTRPGPRPEARSGRHGPLPGAAAFPLFFVERGARRAGEAAPRRSTGSETRRSSARPWPLAEAKRAGERLEAGQRIRRAAETPAPALPCDWGRGGGPPPPQGREGAEAGGRPRGSRRRLSRPGRGGPGKRPDPAARGPAERLQARAAGTRRRTARGGGSLQAAGSGRKLTCTWGVHRWRPY